MTSLGIDWENLLQTTDDDSYVYKQDLEANLNERSVIYCYLNEQVGLLHFRLQDSAINDEHMKNISLLYVLYALSPERIKSCINKKVITFGSDGVIEYDLDTRSTYYKYFDCINRKVITFGSDGVIEYGLDLGSTYSKYFEDHDRMEPLSYFSEFLLDKNHPQLPIDLGFYIKRPSEKFLFETEPGSTYLNEHDIAIYCRIKNTTLAESGFSTEKFYYVYGFIHFKKVETTDPTTVLDIIDKMDRNEKERAVLMNFVVKYIPADGKLTYTVNEVTEKNYFYKNECLNREQLLCCISQNEAVVDEIL